MASSDTPSRNQYRCCIPDCKNVYQVGATKHFFRVTTERYASWRQAITSIYPDFELKSFNAKICQDHFSLKNFTSSFRKILSKYAVPDFPSRTSDATSDCNDIICVDLDTPAPSPVNESPTPIETCNKVKPKKKYLYNISKSQMIQLIKVKKVIEEHKNEFKLARRLRNWKLFLRLNQELSDDAVRFVQKYRDNRNVKNDWSVNNKVKALSLYQRNPRVYKYLLRFLKLPSVSLLNSILNSFFFEAGVDNRMFNELKRRLSKMYIREKHCCLIFNEIPLSHVTGVEDEDSVSHALVFIISGLYKSYVQPVAYYFTNDQTEVSHLGIMIKEVITALQMNKIRIICTVCDQDSRISIALKQLINECQSNGPEFTVNDRRIIVIYDPPRLLTNIRDSLKKYDIKYDEDKIAKWEHIVETYWNDKSYKHCFLHNLKDEDLTSRKTNVFVAARTMSYKMAACINSRIIIKHLPETALNTASFVADIDKLFDSFYSGTSDDGKLLRKSLDKKSAHLKFWNEILNKIESWQFLRINSNEQVEAPSCKEGWISTIKAILLVWEECRKIGIWQLKTRSLNMLPMDNLFAQIRRYSRSKKPEPCQFVSVLKTSILKGLVSPRRWKLHHMYDEMQLLDNMRDFVFQ